MSDARISSGMRLVSMQKGGKVIVQEAAATHPGARKPVSPEEKKEADGYTKGYQEAWKTCEKKYVDQIAQLQASLSAVAQQIPLALAANLAEQENQVREEVCELAIFLAEQIIRLEHPRQETIASVIKELLPLLTSTRNAVLHLHPLDLEIISHASAGEGVPTGIKLEPDTGLARGEAYVDGPQGTLDATLNSRLAMMHETLYARLEDALKNHVSQTTH